MTTIHTTEYMETIDFICWKYYGHTNGTVEAVLEANYGLAKMPALLPLGVDIILPDLEPEPEQTIRLWDVE